MRLFLVVLTLCAALSACSEDPGVLGLISQPAKDTWTDKAKGVATQAKGAAERNPTITGAVAGAAACAVISGGLLSLPCAVVGGLIGHWSGQDPVPTKKDAPK